MDLTPIISVCTACIMFCLYLVYFAIIKVAKAIEANRKPHFRRGKFEKGLEFRSQTFPSGKWDPLFEKGAKAGFKEGAEWAYNHLEEQISE